MKTETLAVGAEKAERRRFRVDFKDYGVLIGLIALIVFLSLSTDTFLTQQNLVNLLDQAVVVGLIAIGATLCIISGVFDLSATANLAISAIAGVYFTQMFGVGLGFVLALWHIFAVARGLVLDGKYEETPDADLTQAGSL